MIESFNQNGYVVLPGQIPTEVLDRFEAQFLSMVPWENPGGTRGEFFTKVTLKERGLEQHLYAEVRHYPYLLELCSDPSVTQAVGSILQKPFGVLSKIPLRIDLPLVTRELAVWHQDQHYVRGNLETITAWIPLQDTGFKEGCLMVMPGSHKLGPVDHDVLVLGKRHYPTQHLNRYAQYVPIRRGDLLLFHSCLLHSGNLNLSDTVRLSVQARYTPLGLETDPAMGKVIAL